MGLPSPMPKTVWADFYTVALDVHNAPALWAYAEEHEHGVAVVAESVFYPEQHHE
jgi:hypothetical protein